MSAHVNEEYVHEVFGEHGVSIRQAIDIMVSAGIGGLIVYGESARIVGLCDGGFVLDIPITPQRIVELSKMDGAVIIDADRGHIIGANVNLVPDPTIPSDETGMRHRAADRVSKQTGAAVAAVSPSRAGVTIYSSSGGTSVEGRTQVLHC